MHSKIITDMSICQAKNKFSLNESAKKWEDASENKDSFKTEGAIPQLFKITKKLPAGINFALSAVGISRYLPMYRLKYRRYLSAI